MRLWLGHGLAKDFAKQVVLAVHLQSRRRSAAGASEKGTPLHGLGVRDAKGRATHAGHRRERLAYLVQIGALGFPELFVALWVASVGPAVATFLRDAFHFALLALFLVYLLYAV